MNKKSVEITITQNIKTEDIESLLDSAGRGAGYWANTFLKYESEVNKVLYEGGVAQIKDWEEDKTYMMDKQMVIKGLEIMANTQPTHYADFISGKADDDTGDVFLQCALMGEVIYS